MTSALSKLKLSHWNEEEDEENLASAEGLEENEEYREADNPEGEVLE